jgi:hypothetical protein
MKKPALALVVALLFGRFGIAKAYAEDSSSAPSEILPVAVWDVQYDAARLMLRDGLFAKAAESLAWVAQRAPDVGRKRLALEQSWLALYWSKRGYQLELLAPEERSASAARFRDKRTVDELALLYTTAVIYGIGSGVTLSLHTAPASPAGYILPIIGLAAASSAAVYQLDRKPLRYGGAQAITSGLFLGLEEGLTWVMWQQSKYHGGDEYSGKTVSTLLWGASTAGAVLGGVVGQVHGITPGRASLIGSGALWSGLAVGLAVGDATNDSTVGLFAAGLALNLGAVGAFVMGETFEPSIGRVRFIDLGGLSGALVFGGLYTAAFAGNNSDGRGLWGVTAAGMVAGLGTAWVLTSSMSPDDPQRTPSSPLVPVVMPVRDSGGTLIGMAGAF